MDWIAINIHLFRMINDLGKEYAFLNPVMIFIAEYLTLFLAATVMLFWVSRGNRNRIMIFCAVITFILSEITAKIASFIHSNKQPFAELPDVNQLIEKAVDNSFPSDHTILFFSFCVTFSLFNKKIGFLWLIPACFVGLSRIWVGVHYPSDVVTGAFISIITALVVFLIMPKFGFTLKLLNLYESLEHFVLSPLQKPKKSNSKDY
ncbi:undecaprenyl-diphosphatase [Niallia oryzisoli]|uniref:Undecaprenyl-diphosphatase n=1 Tax=Niallia oryzisoli TaxID=1737571 RepID=A0ABZ2C8D7_9BACI